MRDIYRKVQHDHRRGAKETVRDRDQEVQHEKSVLEIATKQNWKKGDISKHINMEGEIFHRV